MVVNMPPSPSVSARHNVRRPRSSHDVLGSNAVESVDNVSLAYTTLREAIVWGQLPPGSRISEREIADKLGLSRTPARSALHRLEQEGFVASNGLKERRLIVAPLTMSDGQEVFFIVGHLEGLAARTAAMLPQAERKRIVQRMRDLNRKIAAEWKKQGDVSRIFDLDVEFHRTYVEGVVGPRLLTLHRAIKPQSERYARLYISVLLDELPASMKEHEVIASSIYEGNPRAAQDAVETNWNNAAARIARIIAQHGERGSWQPWRQPAVKSAPAATRTSSRRR
jgi:DNA-binding GntR family transcriptional regulator